MKSADENKKSVEQAQEPLSRPAAWRRCAPVTGEAEPQRIAAWCRCAPVTGKTAVDLVAAADMPGDSTKGEND